MILSILNLQTAKQGLRRTFMAVFFSFFVIYAPSTSAAMQMFLLIEDIKGESKDELFPETIELLSMNWGVAREAPPAGGGGSGVVEVQDLTMTKLVDLASTDLFMAALQGRIIDRAVIIVRKIDEVPLEYFALELENLQITSVSTGGSGGEDRLTENVTLNFGKITTHYLPQKEDGSAGPLKSFCWDIEANADC
jgi:type VI secretion system secreted protein Hcp